MMRHVFPAEDGGWNLACFADRSGNVGELMV